MTFAEHGFEGTSAAALLNAMHISRQSMYDTFGDRRQLYLTALHQYGSDSLASTLTLLSAASSPLAGIEDVLMDFATSPRRFGASSCLGVSSICEFGCTDAEVTSINGKFGASLERALERQVKDAIEAGEIDPQLSPREAASYLSATLCGMKVSAQGGMSPAHLKKVARLALRSLALLG